MKAPPITNSRVGKRLVHIFARGLISLCREHPDELPLPRTIDEFQSGIMKFSRRINLQAGVAFLVDRHAHRDFYELLGINPDYAGRPYGELSELVSTDESLARGLKLVSAFATPAHPCDRETAEAAYQRSAQIFREVGGPEFEAIAVAFENGDCQYELVFDEMQRLLTGGRRERLLGS